MRSECVFSFAQQFGWVPGEPHLELLAVVVYMGNQQGNNFCSFDTVLTCFGCDFGVPGGEICVHCLFSALVLHRMGPMEPHLKLRAGVIGMGRGNKIE